MPHLNFGPKRAIIGEGEISIHDRPSESKVAPINLYDPADFGFPEGSPIFSYSRDARRAINEARMRIQGSQAYIRFWERVLTATERGELGNDVEECFQTNPISINLLCELRDWNPERAIVEIAHRIGFLTQVDYEWLREVVGVPVLDEPNSGNPLAGETPVWDHQVGRLDFRGKLCRDLHVARAKTIVPILDAFQEADWPPTVEYQDDTVDPQRIHQLVRNLNCGLTGIRFSVQDRHICWHPV